MMNRFTRFSFAATAATYILIFVGGLVRVSGAGLGCPDWPRCFGRWIPPTDISQLPANIDPSQFNFALAWIEYINRLIGMSVGLLIGATAIWALFAYRKQIRVIISSGLAGLLVAYQGWQGSHIIESQLDSTIVSIHMGLAFIIAMLMMYTTQQAYYIHKQAAATDSPVFSRLRWFVIGLAVVSMVQVVSGAMLREAIEWAALAFPLLSDAEVLTKIGAVQYVHTVLGIAVVLLTWKIGAHIMKSIASRKSAVGQATIGAMVTASLQLVIGPVTIMFGAPQLMQLLHLVLSALYMGILVLMFSGLKYAEE
ncbi:MAG: COX15/CtaA family protein [Candidatus Zixiibacteriota bacterium]